MKRSLKNTTTDDSLVIYAELNDAEIRAAQRRLKTGELARIVPSVLSASPEEDWPSIVALHRIRLLAALFPGAVIGFRSAFKGGIPVDGVIHLSYSYNRIVELPGLKVILVKGHGQLAGDQPMSGRNLFFPSQARMLMENLTASRGVIKKAVGQIAVEERLVGIYESRGAEALNRIRDEALALAPLLGFDKEYRMLNELIGTILGTKSAQLVTVAGKALAAGTPVDADRLALFEALAAVLRVIPFSEKASPTGSEAARINFAFLESYFSNFIEGTEFDVSEARQIALDGRIIDQRPKDSHDILGVFRQAINPGWANQSMAIGEAVLHQLRQRHTDLMKERPEASPGDFKDRENFAGNTTFVSPRNVMGTLIEGSKLLPSVPPGMARALLAMFIVSEVHPFIDGNGRLARLVMNAELSVVNASRIIVPTLFREEYLDCLRVLTRQGKPEPFIEAMQYIQQWTAAFDYTDLDRVINQMKACNAFEKSRRQFQLLNVSDLDTHLRQNIQS
ncbi:cell filamentation protein Fic [Chlorobaculum limnaeum]|uniref:Cell filamentation protein Fic n=1 Tax=Chlorobaculum limnaeum TaxID=274537 RepID=A0A1D8D1Q2_CHLLM|nr:Fic family protein [Chlorobaculum limnaeum]AOS84331.1 cell filamentation protein Fic [Chlorobaculum limnaeum]